MTLPLSYYLETCVTAGHVFLKGPIFLSRESEMPAVSHHCKLMRNPPSIQHGYPRSTGIRSMLIAQAVVHGMTILTPDPEMEQYAVRVLW